MKQIYKHSLCVILAALFLLSQPLIGFTNSDHASQKNMLSDNNQHQTKECLSDCTTQEFNPEEPFTCGNTTGGEKLYYYGFIKGNKQEGQFEVHDIIMEDERFTNAQLAVIITQILGCNEEAAKYDKQPEYLDTASFPLWAKPYIAYIQDKQLMVGDAEHIFDANGFVTEKQLLAVVLRALEYDVEEGNIYKKASELGISLFNFIPENEGILTRGQAFEILWSAVSRPIMKNGEMLGIRSGHFK